MTILKNNYTKKTDQVTFVGFQIMSAFLE